MSKSKLKEIVKQRKDSEPNLINQLFARVFEAGGIEKQVNILSEFNDINVKDKNGFTILHHASQKGEAALVKVLIERFKARIDETNLDRQIALHLSVNNNTQAAKYLLESGANVFAKSSTGQNVLHYAAQYGKKSFIEWLFSNYLKDKQKQEIIKSKDNDGKNALHYTVLSCKESAGELINILYDNGIDINEKNNYGYTALHFAASRNPNKEVLSILIDFDADIQILNINGDSALQLAIKSGNQIAAEYLEEVEFKRYARNIDFEVKGYLKESVSTLYKTRGEGKSRACYNKALKVAEAKGDYCGLCYTLNKLGDFHLSKANYIQAAKFYSSGYILSTKYQSVRERFGEEYFYNKHLSVQTKFIREVCDNRESIPEIDFINYRNRLVNVRKEISQDLTQNHPSKQVKEILVYTSNLMKTIFIDLLESTMKSIGVPPCEYSFLGLGAMSKDEVLPYPSIKFAIVVGSSDKNTKEYFNKVVRLLELKVVSLGETRLPILQEGKKSVTLQGFSLDNNYTPLSKKELIGTIEELIEFQSKDKASQELTLADKLRNSCFLKGSAALYKSYEKKVAKILSKKAGKKSYFNKGFSIAQEQALAMMKENLSELALNLSKENVEGLFNIGKEIQKPASNFISNIGLFYNLREQNSWQVLEALEKMKVLSSEGAINLKKIIELSRMLQMKTHLYCGCKREFVHHKAMKLSGSIRTVYEISDKEFEQLVEGYKILFALYESIKTFIESKGKKDFKNESFYSKQIIDLQGITYERRISTNKIEMSADFLPLIPEKIIEDNSWHFEASIRTKELKKGQVYHLLDGSKEDKQKVVSYYQHHPVLGYDIQKVEVIYNPGMNREFSLCIERLQQRDNNPAFKPKWQGEAEKENREWRGKINALLEDMARPYIDNDYPAVKILPLWHGTAPQIVDSIFRTGFANLATTDTGFFGKGIYSAHEAEYAHRVYSKGALLLNWVACFSAYPVIYCDRTRLEGGSNYGNYDAHFVPVVPITPDPKEINYWPTQIGQEHTYTEMVVFQSNACLPRYLVTLQPTLTKALPLSINEEKEQDKIKVNIDERTELNNTINEPSQYETQADQPVVNELLVSIRPHMKTILSIIIPFSQISRRYRQSPTYTLISQTFADSSILMKIFHFVLDEELSPVILNRLPIPNLFREFSRQKVLTSAEQQNVLGII